MTDAAKPMEMPVVCIVDDDADVRRSLVSLLRSVGIEARAFAHPDEFLAFDALDDVACLVLDVRLRGVNGLDFQEDFLASEASIPVILMSGFGDIPMTVRGMRAGAVTFLPKPCNENDMLDAINEAIARDRERRALIRSTQTLQARFEALTPRERDVLGLVTAGLLNKQIAARLELSEITVKIYRGNLMRKMEADSLADLVLMADRLGVRETASRYQRRTSEFL